MKRCEKFEIDPSQYFEGVERDRAVKSLATYLGEEQGQASYTGAKFEDLISRSDPDLFTPWDVLAVQALSIPAQPAKMSWLLNDVNAQASALLRQIPKLAIADAPDLLAEGEAADRLWHLLRPLGVVTRSKILSAKRPSLIPIKDSVVVKAMTGCAISQLSNWWELWVTRSKRVDAPALFDSVRSVRSEVGGDALVLSELRTVDIVVWMRHHGWTFSSVLKNSEYESPVGA